MFKIFSGLFAFILFSKVYADDALVLPQGKFRLRWVSSYSEIENQYKGDGSIESLGSSFSRNIDGNLMAALTHKKELSDAVKKLNSLAPGMGDSLLSEQIASLKTDIATQVFANQFVLEYGLTSRLSLGLIVPVIHGSVDVNSVSIPDSNFEQKTAALSSSDPRKALRAGLSQTSSMAAINQLLRQEFGYQDGLKSWSGTGLGDIEVGMKYNYFREHPLRATVKSGVRLPTGRQDDPNQLFDLAFGDGQVDVAAFHYVDFDLLSNLSFTWETGYTMQLPDSHEYRIPLSADLPIGASVVSLDRKLGDYWETGLEANLSPVKRITLSAKYRFKQKFEDAYEGPSGVDTSLLEADSSEILHEGHFQFEYTNLPDVKAGIERVPYGVVAFYRLPFTGENISDTRTAGLQLKTYF